MKANPRSSRRLAATLLLAGVALAGCADLVTSPNASIQRQIEAARTPADHEALVVYYGKEVAAARAKAEEHRKMGKGYASWPGGGRGGGSWSAHCNSIASSYDEIASKYEAMAADHRQMAAQAKP